MGGSERVLGDDLPAQLDTLLAEEALVGMAWGLLDGDQGARVGAVGLRDNSAAIAFTTDTRFHVGSITKSLLATGVLRLITIGSLELDSPVNDYLPVNLPVLAGREGELVTLRHLLDHTAGLDDARMWQMFSERPTPDVPLLDAFGKPRSLLRIRAQPGARFSYSNMGYTLLGMVIETVTGQRYESYLDAQLLAPLGMTDSTFAFTTQVGVGADELLAWGHVDDRSQYPAAASWLRPAGQFTSTARDMLRFAEFLMSDGRVSGEVFIDEALMRARGKPTGTEAGRAGLAAGYALGLGRRDRHGVIGYCHGGNIIGFVAMLCIFPEESKAFFYSVNTDSETADYGRIQQVLIAELGLQAAKPTNSAVLPLESVGWSGWYVMSPNRFSSFEYLDNVFGAVHLSSHQGKLAMTGPQQELRWLRPVGHGLYSASDRTTVSHILLRGSRGEYLLSDGFKTYEKVTTAYFLAQWFSLALGLAGMAWLLLVGLCFLLRQGHGLMSQPLAPACGSIALLALPVPLFFAQSFMALGDLTPASLALAAVTGMLPLCMVWTLFRLVRSDNGSIWNRLHGLATCLVLQWCIVLVVAGMMPLRLWF